jgi:hypothetical protein
MTCSLASRVFAEPLNPIESCHLRPKSSVVKSRPNRFGLANAVRGVLK